MSKTILWIIIAIIVGSFLFKHWSKLDSDTMSTSYCYQEKADGFSYHYNCVEGE